MHVIELGNNLTAATDGAAWIITHNDKVVVLSTHQAEELAQAIIKRSMEES